MRVRLYRTQVIVGQTYTNLEIILVNDGSTDGSGEICDRYAEQDKRIQVIHKENGGQSSARNIALDQMQGEWVLFVDSDDWIELNTLEQIFALKDEKAELVEFGWRFIYRDNEKLFMNESCLVSGREALRALVHTDSFMGLMGNKLFKASLLRGLRFRSGYSFEDSPFVMEVLSKVSVYQYVVLPLYNYRRDREGQTTAGFTDKRLDLFRNVEDLIEKYAGTDLVDYLRTFYVYWVKNNWFEAYIMPREDRRRVMQMLKPFMAKAKTMPVLFLDRKTNLSWRAFYAMPWLYAFLVVHVQPAIKKLLSPPPITNLNLLVCKCLDWFLDLGKAPSYAIVRESSPSSFCAALPSSILSLGYGRVGRVEYACDLICDARFRLEQCHSSKGRRVA